MITVTAMFWLTLSSAANCLRISGPAAAPRVAAHLDRRVADQGASGARISPAGRHACVWRRQDDRHAAAFNRRRDRPVVRHHECIGRCAPGSTLRSSRPPAGAHRRVDCAIAPATQRMPPLTRLSDISFLKGSSRVDVPPGARGIRASAQTGRRRRPAARSNRRRCARSRPPESRCPAVHQLRAGCRLDGQRALQVLDHRAGAPHTALRKRARCGREDEGQDQKASKAETHARSSADTCCSEALNPFARTAYVNSDAQAQAIRRSRSASRRRAQGPCAARAASSAPWRARERDRIEHQHLAGCASRRQVASRRPQSRVAPRAHGGRSERRDRARVELVVEFVQPQLERRDRGPGVRRAGRISAARGTLERSAQPPRTAGSPPRSAAPASP